MNYILGINFRFAVHTVMLVDSQISMLIVGTVNSYVFIITAAKRTFK